MKILLTILLLMSANAIADTAWYMDLDRSGEGMILTELEDGRLAFAFYSHKANAGIPPSVSPQPPPPLFCDEFTVWFTGYSDLFLDGLAAGDVYYDVAVDDFPLAENGKVSEQYVVGSFVIYEEGEGFVLRMESNYIMCNLSVFGVDHHFLKKIAE